MPTTSSPPPILAGQLPPVSHANSPIGRRMAVRPGLAHLEGQHCAENHGDRKQEDKCGHVFPFLYMRLPVAGMPGHVNCSGALIPSCA